jgi:hypothetical protein
MTNGKSITLLLLVTMGACGAFAQTSMQPAFASPAEATQNLFRAVKDNDVSAISSILGGPTELASSHDDSQDKMDRELFAEKYQQMHRIGRNRDGSMTLYVGAENWPFPVPLVQKDGLWRFDADTGEKEVLYRRIGVNELAALGVCHQFVAAEKGNAAPEAGTNGSPVRSLTTTPADSQPVLFHGYYFRVLRGSRPGGYALIAYPAEYRSSGVMTFAVTNGNVVYEKDLGADSSSIANAMRTFKRDPSWHRAKSEK